MKLTLDVTSPLGRLGPITGVPGLQGTGHCYLILIPLRLTNSDSLDITSPTDYVFQVNLKPKNPQQLHIQYVVLLHIKPHPVYQIFEPSCPQQCPTVILSLTSLCTDCIRVCSTTDSQLFQGLCHLYSSPPVFSDSTYFIV